jgi:hypothetical protein
MQQIRILSPMPISVERPIVAAIMANRLHANGLLSTGAIKKNNYAATTKQ